MQLERVYVSTAGCGGERKKKGREVKADIHEAMQEGQGPEGTYTRRLTWTAHGTDCFFRPASLRRPQKTRHAAGHGGSHVPLQGYGGEKRAAKMAAWQEEQLAEMPIIERQVIQRSCSVALG
jgi:hypothetical protein